MSTITLTSVQNPAATLPSLNLTISFTPVQKVQSFVDELLHSPLFLQETQDKIRQWHAQYLTLSDQEELSMALCYLLCQLIRPLMIEPNCPEANLEALFHFEDQIRALIALNLPPSENIDAFIDSFETHVHEKESMDSHLDRIERCYDDAIAQLYKEANAFNERTEQTFNQLRERIVQINLRRDMLSNQMKEKLDQLKDKVDRLNKLLETASKELEKMDRNSAIYQQNYQKLIDQSKKFIKQA
jgi:hypothetical protein